MVVIYNTKYKNIEWVYKTLDESLHQGSQVKSRIKESGYQNITLGRIAIYISKEFKPGPYGASTYERLLKELKPKIREKRMQSLL